MRQEDIEEWQEHQVSENQLTYGSLLELDLIVDPCPGVAQKVLLFLFLYRAT